MSAYDHPESIYNIIPPKEMEVEKPPMYKSKFSKVRPTASTFGVAGTTAPLVTNISGDIDEPEIAPKKHRTFGNKPGANKNDPNDYMKKNAKTTSVQALNVIKQEAPHLLQPTQLKAKLKPDVPKTSDKPVMNLVTSKNFVVANAVETILAAPKKVTQSAKEYMRKEDYGKVPKYLSHIKKDIEAEYDYIMQMREQEEENQRPQVRPMEEAERLALIAGLKAKWEQVNTDYQGATHLTKLDTHGKIQRKERNEASLSQIEKDIEKLNRKNIMVDALG